MRRKLSTFVSTSAARTPICAHRVICRRSPQRTGRDQFDYVPVLLGGVFKATGNRSPFEAFAGSASNKLDYERLEIRALRARSTDMTRFRS